MQDLRIVRVIDVCEYAEELAVDVFDDTGEGLRVEGFAGLGGKDVLIIHEVLD